MDDLSAAELEELSDAIGLPVKDGEMAEVRATVATFHEELDAVDELPTSGSVSLSERRWRPPDSNPYNAISRRCHVPPATDHSGDLSGIEVGLKEIIAVGGLPMECGSATMAGYVPRTDATVVERLREAGGTITTTLALDEFAGSASGTTGVDGPVRNPHDPERTAGGSSGGSAVAVAIDDVDVALGTDTGGSVRIPASFCGIVGLKPSYGLIPLTGVGENTYTLDHVGTFAETVSTTARILDVLAGADDADPASLQAAGRAGYRIGDYESAVEAESVENVTVGVLKEGFGDGVSSVVAEHTLGTIDELEADGVTVESVSVDHFSAGKAVKNLLSLTELATLWRDGGVPYRRASVVDDGYQAAFAARSRALGRKLSTWYKSKLLAGAALVERDYGLRYGRAQAARDLLARELDDALDGVDCLVLPTMPETAPRIADAPSPDFDYARNTRLANITRAPALTLPNGTVDDLPVGLQLLAGEFEERTLLRVASYVESRLA
ncbi:amidase family protein [Halococcus salifodinae]|uniref:Amidase n=1 Tax=Halococcus salifodinae DSM 8989 TaxID=1227456 RepID=M0NA52_9EURY|nr:amidase family protein [Halococcus salifodinae]EMA54761.1 amidase [Halococcus salifodinae DSM 8989]